MAYVTSGLQLYLDGRDFTNSPQTTTWNDRSGNNNNGTPSGFSYTASSGSDGNDGVVFDGVNDTVSVANTSALQLTTGLTIEASFTMNALPTTEMYILGKNSYNDYKMSIKSTGILYFTITTSSATDVTISTALTVGTRYHVVGTYDGTNMNIYLNGNLVKTQAKTGTIHTSTSVLSVGSDRGLTLYFNGGIRLVRLYNRALTQTEATQNYNDAINPTTTVTNNLTGSIALTSNVSASLAITKSLGGTVNTSSQLNTALNVTQLSALSCLLGSTLGINGILSVAKELVSAISLNSLFNGSLVIANNLVGNVDSVSIISGNLCSDRQINASIVTSTIVSANLNIGKPLASNANIISSVQGVISQTNLLTANVNSCSNVLGSLNAISNSFLVGSVISNTSIVANINKVVNLSESIDIKSNIQSSLAGIIVTLSGNVTAKIQAGSFIDKYVDLLGSTSSKLTVASNITIIQIVSLVGNINSKSDIQASVFLIKNLDGQVNANSSTQAYMNLTEIIYTELYMKMANKYDLDMTLVNEHELNMKCVDEYDLNMVYTKSSDFNMHL